ncbi:hypothetical protein ID866_11648 [Astraeus odoratus]|nr:hypothetical protein ID866_11648 [Astraeus odoratus]
MSSPHEILLVKTKDPHKCMEEDWDECQQRQEAAEHQAHKEADKKAWEEADKKAWEEAEQKAQEVAERKVEEEHKPQEAAARAKEDIEREDAVWRAAEAAEERAEVERRALEERLWEVVVQHSAMAVAPLWVAKPSGRMTVAGPSIPGCRASGVQDPCTRCHNKGTPCVLGAAKGKTMVCEACYHTKASCSWSKKMVRETQKQKWVQRLEERKEREVIDVDEDKDEEQSHFVGIDDDPGHVHGVLQFQRDYWGFSMEVLKVIDTIAQELKSANDLKEEEMGRGKEKGKEKAQEEFRRARTEDNDGDTEMGRAEPSSLV